jgi:hypothetical protein
MKIVIMEPTLSDGLLFANTAKEIWDSVVETYSEQNNIAIVFELKQEIAHHRQGDKSLAEYYSSL